MFKAKEFPYLFTILISLIGWTVNHITDEIVKSKALMYQEYYSEVLYEGNFHKYNGMRYKIVEYTIKNLTNDYLFKDVNLNVQIIDGDENGLIFIKDIQEIGVLDFLTTKEDTVMKRKAHFLIEGLHPKTAAKLIVYYQGKIKPAIFLEYNSVSNRNNSKPILFIKSGPRTWILENKLFIFSSLLILWLFLIGVYFYQTVFNK